MPWQPSITGTRYMISAGHWLATQAGFEILEAGGNAVDAGVAAGIALGVVQSDMVQVPGVAPIMIYLAEQDRVLTISGLGWWPRRATLAHFLDREAGKIPLGVLRTVVPAAPDAWILALERFGTMRFADVARSAIRFARDGFTMHPLMAHYIQTFQGQYRMWPGNEAIYLPDGKPPAVGDLFVQSDLARTLQFMSDEEQAAGGSREDGLRAARDAFYRGDIAAAIVRCYREHDGFLDAEDLATYRSAIEPAVRTTFEGVDVYACGPWCQGPTLLQMLSILEGFDLRGLGHNSLDYIHVVTEAMKLAFADRERWYGDPRFTDVPLPTLLSPAYAAQRRSLVRTDEAWADLPPAGEPGPSLVSPVAEGPPPLPADTSYVCVVDAAGNAFSATPSDVSYEGPVVPGTGFCPSSRGSQSHAVAGHPAAIAPGKRPRLTPNPALAIRPGEWVLPFGTPGGDTQCQGMLQFLLNRIVFGMGPQDAIEAPRFVTHSAPNSFEPHERRPASLSVEARVPEVVTDALAGRGHKITRLEEVSWWVAGLCAVEHDLKRGLLTGGADPRRPARALGW